MQANPDGAAPQPASAEDEDGAETEPDEDSTDDSAGDDDEVVDGPGSLGDSLYPGLGNAGYDVQSYDLDLVVDVHDNQLEAESTMLATATEELTLFHLDLHGLDVESILVEGAAADFSRQGDELIIEPTSALASGATFETVVSYGGRPEALDDPSVPFSSGWQNMDGTIFVASEPSGAASFFPSNNHPSDKATFTIRITADSSLTSAATGTLVEEIDNGDTTTTVWEMNDPMTTYLASIYIGDFERRETTGPNGLLIRNYFPPESADELEIAFAETGDIIAFYEDIFGAPYPFDSYGSIVVPFPLGYALENQTLSLHGSDATDSYIVAHEIMHQWAGNSVTVGDWQDIWMLEGFATYFALLYVEESGGLVPFDLELLYLALQAEDTGYGPAEVPRQDLFGTTVYFRGALALHALRTEVGDEKFREIMGVYYETFAGGDVTTEEFQQVVNDVAGDEAQATLDSWLFDEELPPPPGELN